MAKILSFLIRHPTLGAWISVWAPISLGVGVYKRNLSWWWGVLSLLVGLPILLQSPIKWLAREIFLRFHVEKAGKYRELRIMLGIGEDVLKVEKWIESHFPDWGFVAPILCELRG